MGVKSTKNFIVSNAVENILAGAISLCPPPLERGLQWFLAAISPCAVPKVRDRGEPDYRNKADFGRVPAYLSEIKREIAEEKEFIATVLAEQSATHSGPRVPSLLLFLWASVCVCWAPVMFAGAGRGKQFRRV